MYKIVPEKGEMIRVSTGERFTSENALLYSEYLNWIDDGGQPENHIDEPQYLKVRTEDIVRAMKKSEIVSVSSSTDPTVIYIRTIIFTETEADKDENFYSSVSYLQSIGVISPETAYKIQTL